MRPVYHSDILQGTEEWDQLRAGRLSGTSCHVLLTKGKSETGLGADAYRMMHGKVAEFWEGKTATRNTPAMERGNELEPLARMRYEEQEFKTVRELGYVSLGKYLGYSPDGLVGKLGLIEIKCPMGKEFVNYRLNGKIKKEYFAQMQWGMWMTGRTWCDFIVFHPEFTPDILVRRIWPDKETHKRFTEMAPVWEKEIEKALEKMAADC